MRTAKSLAASVAAKVAAAAALTVVWALLVKENGISLSAPMALMCAVYLAAAWFRYLAWDGFKMPSLKRKNEDRTIGGLKGFVKMAEPETTIDAEETDDDEDEAADKGANGFRLSITSRLMSAAIAAAISFILHFYPFGL